jgi:Amino acid synthesis
MLEVLVRKYVTQVEEILHEGGPVSLNPPKRGAIAAVIENPFAGSYVENGIVTSPCDERAKSAPC